MKFINDGTVLTVCLLLFTHMTFADDKGFYLGGSLGYSSIDSLDEGDINANLAGLGITATSDVDDNDLGWKIFGGYNINQYFGIEAAYVDLGEAEADITITAPAAGTSSLKADADGFSLAGIARYPVHNQIDIFGKVGAFFWDVNGDAIITVGGVTANINSDDDGTDVLFGLGAEYEFNKHIGVRAEWEHYKIDSDDVDLFSIGFEYDF